ncbi:MAG: hypothetical protein HY647_05925 [Acidobacteria bacterium]|nr:hypothetical protein [Acidobacteriota bacterium]
MSLLRMIQIGSYMAGAAALLLAFGIRFGFTVGDFTPRGLLFFSIACFLCTLATREILADTEKPKPPA